MSEIKRASPDKASSRLPRPLWVAWLALCVLVLTVGGLITSGRHAGVTADVGQVVDHAVMIPQVVGQPILDGDITEWLALPSIPLLAALASRVEGAVPTEADCSAALRMGWDALNLYLAISVTDDMVAADNQPQWWFEDGIELGIDGNNDHAAGDASDHQYALLSDGRRGDFFFPSMQIRYAIRRVPGGWTGEAVIPLSHLRIPDWNVGKTFGFTWAVNDDDQPGAMALSSRLVWAGVSTNPPASDWGQVTLHWDMFVVGSTPVPGTPTPSPTATPTRDPNDICLRYAPNYTVSQAYGPLENGLTYAAAICQGDFSNDFYWIQVPRGSYVRASVSGIPENADIDLYLYDVTLQLIGRSTGIGPTEMAGFLARTTGIYYVRLYSFRPVPVASYQLTLQWEPGRLSFVPVLNPVPLSPTPSATPTPTVTPTSQPGTTPTPTATLTVRPGPSLTPTATPTPDADSCTRYEPNDTATSAWPIAIGPEYYAAVCLDDLRDVYRFTKSSANASTVVTLSQIPRGVDYFVWLYDANKVLLGTGEYPDPDGAKHVRHDLSPGLYYVIVGPDKDTAPPGGRSQENYRLQVTEQYD